MEPGQPQPTPPQPVEAAETTKVDYVLPTNRSGWAIAAGYAGIFAILPLFGPVAVVFGLIALRDLKQHPEKHGQGRAMFALIWGSITTLILLIVLVNATINTLHQR